MGTRRKNIWIIILSVIFFLGALLWYFRRELRQSSVRQVITEHLAAYKNRIGHYPQTTNPENLADSLSLNLNLNEIDPDNFSYRPSDRSGGYQLKILK